MAGLKEELQNKRKKGGRDKKPVRVFWDFSSWMFLIGALTAAALAMGLQ